MIRTPTLIALVAAAALAGCNKQDHTLTQDGPADPMANEIANAPPVELPPAIASSKTYRCKDNSVVYVNFMTDKLTANVRDKEEEPPVINLRAAAPGEPFVGEGDSGKGFKLVGSGASVTYTSPDSGTQSCKA